jgi:diguanylate cyclase (GGDEF)-like protein
MTDYQILTIIAAFIIVDIAILSLVAIPLLRRRLTFRIDQAPPAPLAPMALPSDPIAAPSPGRLAAAIGAPPTLSAAVPHGGARSAEAIAEDDLLAGARFRETGEDDVSDFEPSDVIDAIKAARAATEAWQDPARTRIDSDDAQGGALYVDSTEIDIARARGFAIHPEDPLVASTLDRLLGARRDADDSATEAAADASAEAEAGGTDVHVSADVHVTKEGAVRPETATPTAAAAPAEAAGTGHRPEAGRPVMAAGAYPTDGFPEPTIDPETGLESPLSWSMAITIEEARSGRYGRPVSVVIAELDGFERLTELFGAEAADRLIPPVADALRHNARAADRVARLSRTRFGILLVETDEIRAINYVERVRSACDRWLEASAIALRLSIGWASPATDGDLRSAVRIAEDRMYREQHRPAPWRTVVAAAPATTKSPPEN